MYLLKNLGLSTCEFFIVQILLNCIHQCGSVCSPVRLLLWIGPLLQCLGGILQWIVFSHQEARNVWWFVCLQCFQPLMHNAQSLYFCGVWKMVTSNHIILLSEICCNDVIRTCFSLSAIYLLVEFIEKSRLNFRFFLFTRLPR